MNIHFSAAEWQKAEDADYGPIQTDLTIETDPET
jgi:hypothetical protein